MAKNKIGDYKDRMDSPIGIVRTDPKTRKPIKKTSTVKRGKKK